MPVAAKRDRTGRVTRPWHRTKSPASSFSATVGHSGWRSGAEPLGPSIIAAASDHVSRSIERRCRASENAPSPTAPMDFQVPQITNFVDRFKFLWEVVFQGCPILQRGKG